ncbi:MAG: hypothetical protein D4R64_10765 [Porphyromonadaceae bacterium]|nr:MAG: hypothetical protein D4R64_10765 [Porphyromonadaceae bacterium]
MIELIWTQNGSKTLLLKVLTTHIARHTFATTIAMGNNIPIEIITKIFGHSSMKDTKAYAVVEK